MPDAMLVMLATRPRSCWQGREAVPNLPRQQPQRPRANMPRSRACSGSCGVSGCLRAMHRPATRLRGRYKFDKQADQARHLRIMRVHSVQQPEGHLAWTLPRNTEHNFSDERSWGCTEPARRAPSTGTAKSSQLPCVDICSVCANAALLCPGSVWATPRADDTQGAETAGDDPSPRTGVRRRRRARDDLADRAGAGQLPQPRRGLGERVRQRCQRADGACELHPSRI